MNTRASITPETLLPHCQRLWELTAANLPDSHARRWQINRVVQPHGQRRSIMLWRVWDTRTTGHGLDPHYFCWCFNYDPEHYYNRETHWQLHLYANTIRLYRHADALRAMLPRRLRTVCPEDFRFLTNDHSVQLVWNFTHFADLGELPVLVAPRLARALVATAPVFDEVFALLARPDSEASATRKCKPAAPTANPAVPAYPGFSRNIPGPLRRQVIACGANCCALCGLEFRSDDDIHVDHIVPWAEGGLTILENLQATHAACNLRKGKKQKLKAKLKGSGWGQTPDPSASAPNRGKGARGYDPAG